jgi:hypothetical protein
MASTTSSGELKKGRLGVIGIVFFVVAASAPLVGMTGAVPVAMLVGTGSAVPGTYLAVGLTLLLFAVGYSAMSSRVTNTGAFFAYVGRGLGTNMGVASAFTSILAYATIQLAIYGFFGGLVQGTMAGYGIDLPWIVWSGIAWVIITALSLLSVDLGAKVLGVFLVLELLHYLSLREPFSPTVDPTVASTSPHRSTRTPSSPADSPVQLVSLLRLLSPRSSGSKPPQSMVKSRRTPRRPYRPRPTGQSESSPDCSRLSLSRWSPVTETEWSMTALAEKCPHSLPPFSA